MHRMVRALDVRIIDISESTKLLRRIMPLNDRQQNRCASLSRLLRGADQRLLHRPAA
jgi:hypothetical protein